MFTGETVATLVYFLLTLSEPHRVFLVTLTSVTLLALVACIPLTDRFASMTLRSQYSFGWTLLAGVILTVSIHFDGGIA